MSVACSRTSVLSSAATRSMSSAVRAEELIEDRPDLVAASRPLLEARNAVEQQVSELDRKVMEVGSP